MYCLCVYLHIMCMKEPVKVRRGIRVHRSKVTDSHEFSCWWELNLSPLGVRGEVASTLNH